MKEIRTEEDALAAVQTDGFDLRDVPEEFKTVAVCLAAVQQSGRALEYVPEILKTRKICAEAGKQDCWALKVVPGRHVLHRERGLFAHAGRAADGGEELHGRGLARDREV